MEADADTDSAVSIVLDALLGAGAGFDAG